MCIGRMYTEGFAKQFADENIWTKEYGSDRKFVKFAPCVALEF
jgi:hypothetical protein